MRVNTKMAICFGGAIACAVFTGLLLAHFLPSSTAGGAQDDVDRGAEKNSHLSREVERVDLGDGISLKKWGSSQRAVKCGRGVVQSLATVKWLWWCFGNKKAETPPDRPLYVVIGKAIGSC